jgi:hypothetical protein
MRANRLVAICTAIVSSYGAGALAVDDETRGVSLRRAESDQALTEFMNRNHDVRVEWSAQGRMRRVYGPAFATGVSPEATAAAFCQDHATMMGARVEDLVPGARHLEQGSTLPLMYDAATDTYKFTVVYHTQQRGGVPVFGARLTSLVRNEAGFPLVLVNPDVRDLGDYQVDALQAGRPMADAGRQAIEARFGRNLQTTDRGQVIWAGIEDVAAAPRLANEVIVRADPEAWLVLVDVATGVILHEEPRVFHGTGISGSVRGMATEGVGAEQCEDEVSQPLPYLEVTSGSSTGFTDADGNFSLAPSGSFNVSAELRGEWFNVFDFFNNEISLTGSILGSLDLVFNLLNDDEEVRAQVNAYVEANRVRDFAVQFNPMYPTLNNTDFPVTVNRTDNFCPGNAWYSPDEQSINFCLSGGGSPNTAWSSVVHHEYGHHLVNAGGSGQGQYGEGMGDVMSALILDSPMLGFGFFNNCTESLRSADNDLQYPCNSGIHFCGQLISACVWDTRNELAITNPTNYTEILGNIAVNSILLHSGSNIDPSITIDYLTLDDDNGNIFDGTPHFNEIATGFGAHNMDAPELAAIGFNFPNGLPELVAPDGSTTVRVEVVGVTSSGDPGTGKLFLSTNSAVGPFSETAMTPVSPNVYDAVFPASTCGDAIFFYFAADATSGVTQTWPNEAPSDTEQAIVATNLTVDFNDDFETDLGWTVATTASDGGWQRGVPAGDGDRGDPLVDGDGSGQCYLTDNVSGNSDVDDGSTTLTSPTLDASGAGQPFISYRRWYSNTAGDSPFQDIFTVEVSDNDGGSWSPLETVGPSGGEVNGGWFSRQFRVADFVTPNNQFRVRFTASDSDPQSVVEAAVDGIEIRYYDCDDTPAPCPGDANGDNLVDVDDIVAVVLAFGDLGGPADVDNSGTVDVDDIVAVVLAFGSSCP